jgi:succinate dehydrogenase / fumarate reductase flavoprotein subunit
MMDLLVLDNRAQGILVRNLLNGQLERYAADAVVLATGGYAKIFHLSTNAMSGNVTAAWRAHRRGAAFANPCFVQIHPTCIPVHGKEQSKLTLMSESLRNDGRVWVPKHADDRRPPAAIPEAERDYYLERRYPRFGNLVPRDVASRNAKEVCDQGRGVSATGRAVYLDFAEAIARDGLATIERKYGNLFQMYTQITAADPTEEPMMIYPAAHYAMGGLWVDYHLQATINGLFVIGEANFSDHGANRLGASALMQGLADGYFILPATISNYLAQHSPGHPAPEHPLFAELEEEAAERLARLLHNRNPHKAGTQTADQLHRKLGALLWDHCGMARNKEGLRKAAAEIPQLREEFWEHVYVPGRGEDLNQSLEQAGRIADFLEFAETMVFDALEREESCGCHLREESQTEDGEALRDDANYSHVAVWEYQGKGKKPALHKEPLQFEAVSPSQRSYR